MLASINPFDIPEELMEEFLDEFVQLAKEKGYLRNLTMEYYTYTFYGRK